MSLEDAELAAGALFYSIDIVLDELFADVATLTEERTNAAECDGPMLQLDDLPGQFVLQYTARFARHLLVTAVSLTGRMTRPDFEQLSCVGGELLLRLLLQAAEVTLDTYGLLNDGVAAAWECFSDQVYEDMDHEWLYDPSMDGIDQDPARAHLGIAPMGCQGPVHPLQQGPFRPPLRGEHRCE